MPTLPWAEHPMLLPCAAAGADAACKDRNPAYESSPIAKILTGPSYLHASQGLFHSTCEVPAPFCTFLFAVWKKL